MRTFTAVVALPPTKLTTIAAPPDFMPQLRCLHRTALLAAIAAGLWMTAGCGVPLEDDAEAGKAGRLCNCDGQTGYIWPTKGVLTSGFGRRRDRMHKGIDIAGPIGTPVVAAANGEVISAGWNSGGYGNLVKLKHTDGSVTLYAHNSEILVKEGSQVPQGKPISKMGSTGNSTGPHLHFEVHPNGGKAENPIAFLPSSMPGNVATKSNPKSKVKQASYIADAPILIAKASCPCPESYPSGAGPSENPEGSGGFIPHGDIPDSQDHDWQDPESQNDGASNWW